MKKQLIKVLSVPFVCLIFITSLSLSAFASSVNLPVVQVADNTYDFDLDTAISSLSDLDVNSFNSVAYTGFLTDNQTPNLIVTYYNISSSSDLSNTLELSPYIGAFSLSSGYFTRGFLGNLELRLNNYYGQTLFLNYYSIIINPVGSVLSSSKSLSVIPLSANSSQLMSSFNTAFTVSGTITFGSEFFNVPQNSALDILYMPVTSVGYGLNTASVSSGSAPNVPYYMGLHYVSWYYNYFIPKVNQFSYGSLDSALYGDISNNSELLSDIAFNFTVNGAIVRGPNDEFSVINYTPPSEPDNPSGGSTSGSSFGTASGSYDSSTGDINVDVNLEQDYSPLIDYGNSEDVPSISDSSANEFESAVSDLPTIQDSDLDTVFENYDFDNNNNAISWIYSVINTVFRGNEKVFSLLLSFLLLSLIMLILNKRG